MANSAPDKSRLTPMMQQYYALKEEAGDAILFFRMGDFYELFDSDAELVAPILEIVLTSRERGDKNKVPFCGVPHHSARNYYLRLLKKGFKVAIADQVEDPAEAKGIVKRAIVKMLSPGCIDDLEGLEGNAPNYLAALHEQPNNRRWTLVVADVSTGEVRQGNFESSDQAVKAMDRYRPRELLVRRFMMDRVKSSVAHAITEYGLVLSELPEGILQDEVFQARLFKNTFGTSSLVDMPCGEVPGGEGCLAALLTYLDNQKISLAPFRTVRPLFESNTMHLSDVVIRDLELFETVRRRNLDGSLFKEVNFTVSPMGARYLRYTLAHPITDRDQITKRHTSVETLFAAGYTTIADLRSQIKHTPDLERLMSRVLSGLASPVELFKTRQALIHAHQITAEFFKKNNNIAKSGLFPVIATGLKKVKTPLKLLEEALDDEVGSLGTAFNVFRNGYNKEFDALVEMARSGESKINEYQDRLREETGIASLKIKFHKTFGLLIEVTKSNLKKVPESFIRRQTMVNCERFVTDELLDLGEKLSHSQEQALAMEAKLFNELLLKLSSHRVDLRTVVEAFATFDLLLSFSWLALTRDFCRPQLSTDETLSLTGSRHPVVERFVGAQEFTPNDVSLTKDCKLMLITGPNMAGKSTVMRQTALIAILCQAGCFVPARSATLPVFDRIFTRIGAADDITRGQSTFMVEMSEAAIILREATDRSLVILDEVGRGTSTTDGLAIASAILQTLAKQTNCHTMFATHYHELVEFVANFSNVKTCQTEVNKSGDTIEFTHRLKPGSSGKSYGLEVAKLAGIPNDVIALSESLIEEEGDSSTEIETVRKGAVTEKSEVIHDPNESEWLEKIFSMNLDRTTPLQALNLLAKIQSGQEVQRQSDLFGNLEI